MKKISGLKQIGVRNKNWMISAFLLLFQTILSGQENINNALDLFNEGKVDESIVVLTSIIEGDSKNAEALYLRAYIYLSEGEKSKALTDYSLLLELAPDHVGALTNRSLILMEDEHYKAALADLNKLHELDPDNWQILYERGYCHGLMGEHLLAIDDFSAVIAQNPESADAYAQRGISKINELSSEGLIRPAPEQCTDACLDLNKAIALGDSSVSRMIQLYCPDE